MQQRKGNWECVKRVLVGFSLCSLAAACAYASEAVLISSNQGDEGTWTATPGRLVEKGFSLTWRGLYTHGLNTYWNHPRGTYGGIAIAYEWTAQPEPALTWYKVTPVYNEYTNPWPNWTQLSYNIGSGTSGWDYDSVSTSTIGTDWYFVKSVYDTTTRYSFSGETGQSDYANCTTDGCLRDLVTAVSVYQDYSQVILKWASAQCKLPFILNSHWTHQVQRWIGTDCADMVGHCIKLSGWSSFPFPDSEPYAQGLYGHAAAQRHGLSIRTDWTLHNPDSPSIPQPQPGDVVLIDYDWQSGQHVADHATILESGDGNNANYLDQGDNCFAACYTHRKVHKTTYADA